MSLTRRILLKLEVRPAGRKVTCAHDRRHVIRKGETRFVVKPPGIAGEKGYCADCAQSMVAAARRELEELERQLP